MLEDQWNTEEDTRTVLFDEVNRTGRVEFGFDDEVPPRMVVTSTP